MSGELQSTIAANELATLLIPVRGKQLVLPNVTVAEIIPYTEPQVESDKPGWYLGTVSWRNISVPLVSFEVLNNQMVGSSGRQRRIAVLNGLVDNQKLPFCAIVTEGVPRLMRIMPDEVVTDEESLVGPAELTSVVVSGERASIPNVDYIQNLVLQVL
ncbi:MAG: chemotaxis protein CheW [Spongiibacteraceae bacterium]